MTTKPENKPKTVKPNPYNMHKPWHDEVQTPEYRGDARSMYVPERPKEVVIDTKPKEEEVVEKTEEEKVKEEIVPGTKEGLVPAKRYYDLKNHHDKLVTELRKELEDLKNSNQNVEAKSDNPVDTEDKTKETKAVEEQVKSVEELSEPERRAKRAEAKLAVIKAHPDLDEITSTVAFHVWAEEQDEDTQEWIYDNPYDSDKAIQALDKWKKHLKGLKETKSQDTKANPVQSKEDASVAVDVKSPAEIVDTSKVVWTKDKIKKLSPKEWEKHREEIFASLGLGG